MTLVREHNGPPSVDSIFYGRFFVNFVQLKVFLFGGKIWIQGYVHVDLSVYTHISVWVL